MNKKLLLLIFVALLLVGSVLSADYTLTQFSDGKSSENISFVLGDLNETKYLQIPINSTINTFTINLTGYNYQYSYNFLEQFVNTSWKNISVTTADWNITSNSLKMTQQITVEDKIRTTGLLSDVHIEFGGDCSSYTCAVCNYFSPSKSGWLNKARVGITPNEVSGVAPFNDINVTIHSGYCDGTVIAQATITGFSSGGLQWKDVTFSGTEYLNSSEVYYFVMDSFDSGRRNYEWFGDYGCCAGNMDRYMFNGSDNAWGFYSTGRTYDYELWLDSFNDSETAQSLAVISQTNVTNATLTYNGDVPAGTSVDFFLSNDYVDWISVSNNTRIAFSSVGQNVYWRSVLNTSNYSFTPNITSVNVFTDDIPLSNISVVVNGTEVYNNASNFTAYNFTVDLNVSVLESCNDYSSNCSVFFKSDSIGTLFWGDLFVSYSTFGSSFVSFNSTADWVSSLYSDQSVTSVFVLNNSGDFNASGCNLQLSSVLDNFLSVNVSDFSIVTDENVDVLATISSPSPGVYDEYLDIVCSNGTSEGGVVHSNVDVRVQVTSSTRPLVGGGGSVVFDKPVCDISLSPGVVRFFPGVIIKEVVISNDDIISFDPTFQFRGVEGILVDDLEITNPIFTLLPGTSDSFGLRYDPNEFLVGEALLVLSSDDCADINVSIIASEGSRAISVFRELFTGGLSFVELMLEPVLDNDLRDDTRWFNIGLLSLIIFLLYLALLYKRFKEAVKKRSFVIVAWSLFIIMITAVTLVFVVTAIRLIF